MLHGLLKGFMQIRFKELSGEGLVPDSYVLIGMYGGNSNFPLGCFYVLANWWELFVANPEITFDISKFAETDVVTCMGANPHPGSTPGIPTSNLYGDLA